MKTCKLVLGALLCLCFSATYAQNNVIKTKPLRIIEGAVFGVSPIPLSLSYERTFALKFSASLNVQLGLETELKTINKYALDPLNEAMDVMALAMGVPNLDVELGDLSAKSFAISPEFRFYTSPVKESPRGFYLMAELFYSKSTYTSALNVDYDFTYPFDIPMYGTTDITLPLESTVDLSVSPSMLGAGIGLGTQWIIGKHISIDILWFGIGVGKMKGVTTADIGAKSAAEYQELLYDQLIKEPGEQTGYFTQQEFENYQQSGQLPTITSADVAAFDTLEELTKKEGGDTSSDMDVPMYNATYNVNGNKIEMIAEGLGIRPRLLNFSIGIAF